MNERPGWVRWVALGALATTQLMVILDAMIMVVALPVLQEDLGIARADGQWVLTIYALAFGALLMLGGRLADYHGRKLAFLLGLAGFTGASVLGGLAPDGTTLFLARGLQGAFAALLVPAALATITVLFAEPRERARAMAVYGAVSGSGTALGLILGGVLTEFLSWRWCLLVNLPLGAAALVVAAMTLVESKLPGRPRYDVLGTITVGAGLSALVYGFARAGEDGWSDPITMLALGGGVVALIAFAFLETKVRDPLLPLGLLTRARSVACLSVMCLLAGIYGVFLSLIFFLQQVKGWSALECGLSLLPYAVMGTLTAAVLEQPLGRANPRLVIPVGLLLATVGCAWFGRIEPDSSYLGLLLAPQLILSIGVFITFVSATSVTMAGSTDEDAGVISAVFNTTFQIGGALGAAVLTTVTLEITNHSAGGGPPSPDDITDGLSAGLYGSAAFMLLGALLPLVFMRGTAKAAAPVRVPIQDRPWARWVALGVLATAQLIVVLDGTVMLVALPDLQRDLGIAVADGQWVLTAYALALGGLLLLGGRIADYNGRKRAFLAGLVGFVAMSVLGGLAQNQEMLFAARAGQGVFAALLVPAALSLIGTTFVEPRERARAFGVYGAVSASGFGIGLILGGALTEYLSWRWCLLINLPIGAVALLIAFVVVTDSRTSGRPRYDLLGTATVTAGLVALVYGFTHAAEAGWGDPVTVGCLAGGVVLLVAFGFVETRVSEPLLPMRLLRDPTRVGVQLAGLLQFAGLIGYFLYLIFYFQQVKSWSAMEAGLAIVPYAASAILFAVLLEQRLGRLGPRIPAIGGMLVSVGVLLWLSRIEADWDYTTHLVPALIINGLGVVSAYIALSAGSLDGADEADSGALSALFNAGQQIGLALGSAIVTTVFVKTVESKTDGGPPTPDDLVAGYGNVFLTSVGLMLLGVVTGLVLIRSRAGTAPALAREPVVAIPLAAETIATTNGAVYRTEPVVTETVSTRVSTRRGVSGSVVTVETVTITRTTVETAVSEHVTRRREPGPQRGLSSARTSAVCSPSAGAGRVDGDASVGKGPARPRVGP